MDNKNLDIIQLIEQNPITRFSTNYQSKFIEKIQKDFTDTQQHLFVASFYCYLNYNNNDFVIDLDNIWKWLGFGRKEECKRVLSKHFTQEIDYKIFTKETTIEIFAPQVGGAKKRGWPASGGGYTGYPCVLYRPAPGTLTTTQYTIKIISV